MPCSIGICSHNIESVESNSSALSLRNQMQLDTSLATGHDAYLSPTGGLKKNGPYEFNLNGDS